MKSKLLPLIVLVVALSSCSEDGDSSPMLPNRVVFNQGDVRDVAILLETTRQELHDSVWTNRSETIIAGLASYNIVSVTADGAHALVRLNDVSATTEGRGTTATIQLGNMGAAVFFPADGSSGKILQTDSVGKTEYNFFMQAIRTLKDVHVALPDEPTLIGETWQIAKRDTAIALGATRESTYGFSYEYAEAKDTLKHQAIVIPFELQTVVDRVLQRTEGAPTIDIAHNKVRHNGEMIIDAATGKTISMSSNLNMETTVTQETETGVIPLLVTRMVSSVRVVTVAFAEGMTTSESNNETTIQTDTIEDNQ